MKTDISIRLADINDSPGIAEVHVRSWQAAYRGMLPDELLDGLSIDKRTEKWRTGLRTPDGIVTIVAETPESRIIGWASFSRARDEDKRNSSTGEITAIYILSDYWGQGIGKRLFSYSLAELAKEFSEVIIWVLRQNQQAIGFYEHMGFKRDGKERIEEGKTSGATLDCVRLCRGTTG